MSVDPQHLSAYIEFFRILEGIQRRLELEKRRKDTEERVLPDE